MSDRRPFTPDDDKYILAAHADGAGYCAMARAIGRSVSSIKGRLDRLRNEPVPAAPFQSRERPCSRCGKVFETTPQRRMLCAGCFRDGSESPFDV